jgi:plasmid stabilization system protein ParE
MALQVSWTVNAEEDFRRIISYLLDEWSDTFAEKFSEEVKKKLWLLSEQPYVGAQSSDLSSVRSVSVTRRYKLYYLILRDEVVIVNLLHVNQTR